MTSVTRPTAEMRYWRPSSWSDAVRVATSMRGWLFRGQSSDQWKLETSLERLANAAGLSLPSVSKREERIVNRFRRQASHFLPALPREGEFLELLAFIQHHGGPTRLLDFTRSFYVAAFFAMESAVDTATVWAVSETYLDRRFFAREDFAPSHNHPPSRLIQKDQFANDILSQSFEPESKDFESDNEQGPEPTQDPSVVVVEPWALNQRMVTQQGVFLFPTRVDARFETSLCSAFGLPDHELPPKPNVCSVEEAVTAVTQIDDLALFRMDLSLAIAREALLDLARMNITAASLFPGLDGFARSLRMELLGTEQV